MVCFIYIKDSNKIQAVNHMGHVILTSHLLPLMKKTADKGNTVRIVTLGSNAHQASPSDCKFASLEELNQDLGPNGQYGRSKLAQMLYVKYLNKHLTSTHPKILANSVHPGFVDTKMSREDIHEPYPLGGYAMVRIYLLVIYLPVTSHHLLFLKHTQILSIFLTIQKNG